MKCSRTDVHCKTHSLPVLRFEESQLTSFSGLVLIQELFRRLDLKERLRRCFEHLVVSPIFGHATVVLSLVLHLLMGFRELRDIRYYADDPLVRRTLGLRRLPDVATLSRALAQADPKSVEQLHRLLRELVVARLAKLDLPRVTLEARSSVLEDSPRGRPWDSTVRRKDSAVITRCFARWPKPGKCSMCCTAPVMSMTPMARRPLSATLSPPCVRPSPGSASRYAWIAPSSVTRSSRASMPRALSIRSASPSSASENSKNALKRVDGGIGSRRDAPTLRRSGSPRLWT